MNFVEEQLTLFKKKLTTAEVTIGSGVEEFLRDQFEARFSALEGDRAATTSAKICVKRMCEISIDLAQQEADSGEAPLLTPLLAEEAAKATKDAVGEAVGGPC